MISISLSLNRFLEVYRIFIGYRIRDSQRFRCIGTACLILGDQKKNGIEEKSEGRMRLPMKDVRFMVVRVYSASAIHAVQPRSADPVHDRLHR